MCVGYTLKMPRVRHKESGKEYYPIGDPILGISVLSKGMFSLAYFYEMAHEWFIENGWAGRLDSDFGETFFCQRDSGKHSEIWARWQFRKPSSDVLFYYELDYQVHVLGLTSQETVVKGKKLKLDNGEIEIKFFPRVVINPLWEKARYFKGMQEWYFRRRLMGKKFEHVRRVLYEEAVRLQEALKSYFDLKTFLEIPESQRFYTTVKEGMV